LPRHEPEVAAAPRTSSKAGHSAAYEEEVARHFAWIDWITAQTGLGDTPIAEKAGLAPNYLYRKRGKSPLKPAMIRQIVEALNVPGPDAYQSQGARSLAEEAVPFKPDRNAVYTMNYDTLLEQALANNPNVSAWTLNSHALETEGYLPGDILITDEKVAPFVGEPVCARIMDAKSGKAETVFRILERPYLVAASSDPAFRKPLLIDDDHVIVVGTVVGSFRPRRKP
jgi:hypothetical protein